MLKAIVTNTLFPQSGEIHAIVGALVTRKGAAPSAMVSSPPDGEFYQTKGTSVGRLIAHPQWSTSTIVRFQPAAFLHVQPFALVRHNDRAQLGKRMHPPLLLLWGICPREKRLSCTRNFERVLCGIKVRYVDDTPSATAASQRNGAVDFASRLLGDRARLAGEAAFTIHQEVREEEKSPSLDRLATHLFQIPFQYELTIGANEILGHVAGQRLAQRLELIDVGFLLNADVDQFRGFAYFYVRTIERFVIFVVHRSFRD